MTNPQRLAPRPARGEEGRERMNKRDDVQRVIADLGPIDSWLLPAEEIERVMLRGPCEHGLKTYENCRRCLPRELFRRQVELIALKKGCTPEDARTAANMAVWRHVDSVV